MAAVEGIAALRRGELSLVRLQALATGGLRAGERAPQSAAR